MPLTDCLFQGKSMPNGRETMRGSELTFVNVNRRHSGTYVCKADNGFSVAAEDKITVDVEYKPEVIVEEVFIHAKTGNQVTTRSSSRPISCYIDVEHSL